MQSVPAWRRDSGANGTTARARRPGARAQEKSQPMRESGLVGVDVVKGTRAASGEA